MIIYLIHLQELMTQIIQVKIVIILLDAGIDLQNSPETFIN